MLLQALGKKYWTHDFQVSFLDFSRFAGELMDISRDYIKQLYDSAFEAYLQQIHLLGQIESAYFQQEDGTRMKSKLLSEYLKATDAANSTVGTLLKIMKNMGTEKADDSKLDTFLQELE